MKKAKKPKKVLTPEQHRARNEAARARRWKKTGVSEATIAWMRERGML